VSDVLSDPRVASGVAAADERDLSPAPVRSGPAPDTACAAARGRRAARRSLWALWLADVVALAGAVAVVGALSTPVVVDAVVYAVVVVLAVRHRRVPITLRLAPQLPRLAVAAVLPAVVLLARLSPAATWRVALVVAAALVVTRATAYWVLRELRRRGSLVERAVVVGAGETGRLVARLLEEHHELGVELCGFLDGAPRLDAAPLPVLGTASDLVATVRELGATRVLVCFSMEPDRDLVGVLREARALRVDVCAIPRLHELAWAIPQSARDEIFGVPLLAMRGGAPTARSRRVKRAFDVVVASALLCVLAPVLAVAAVLVRVRIGRPVLFRQRRVTGQGRTATILKLRTLPEHDSPDTTWALPTEGVTGLGRWLRASHIDELPQLVNVIKGEMSLVGPRPERPYFVEQFRQAIPGYEDRERVPAGITGWAQVHGLHGDSSIRDRVRFDNQYIETWTPFLDVVILVRTLRAELRRSRRVRS
jgi:exopolysaccharide biosynthesis polyprenyl glycosylphosphotransferase